MARSDIDPGRRGFLRGRARPTPAVRPPWSDTGRFTALCTRCTRCAEACPEGIIRPGDGGFPEIDFSLGECSFCRACAEACPEPLFAASGRPWNLIATIGAQCLATRRIECRICQDACPEAAVLFRPALRSAAQVTIDSTACTGCGACVSTCPATAITLQVRPEADHAA
jgi:ferredoxin-type protein NapF